MLSKQEPLKLQHVADLRLQALFGTVSTLPRTQRLSLDENLSAKEGGMEKTGKTSPRLSFFFFPWFLALRHGSLACHSLFAVASV